MDYLIEPNRDAVASIQAGCIAPDCGTLGPVCVCDSKK